MLKLKQLTDYNRRSKENFSPRKSYAKTPATFSRAERSAYSSKLRQISLSVFFVFTVMITAQAAQLTFSYNDPIGDHTGYADVTKMTVVFDNITGDYKIILKSTAADPFLNQFRVNVNLFNPDTNTTNSLLQDVFNDYNLTDPTTKLTLTGTSSNLLNWNIGHRVASSSLAGLGDPPGSSFFRTSVVNLPFTFPIQEDSIAFDATGIALIRLFMPQDAIELLICDVEALVDKGILTPDQASGLTDKLRAAIGSLNHGNNRPGCNQLQAFINQVNGLGNTEMLPPNEKQELIDAALLIKSQIGC